MKSARRYLTKRVSYGCVVNSVVVLKIGLGLKIVIIGFYAFCSCLACHHYLVVVIVARCRGP